MPGTPFQSKLEPHFDFIHECRRKRWSYARIAKVIYEKFGMKVSRNAVFSFVKVRSKPLHMYELHSGKPFSAPSNLAGGFFESPAQPTKPNEAKRPKWNIDFD